MKPSLKITKGLVGEIPVEGVCTACPDVVFQVKELPLSLSYEDGQAILQKQFDEHFKKVHLQVSDAPCFHPPKDQLKELFEVLCKADPKLGLAGIPADMRRRFASSIDGVPRDILDRYASDFQMPSPPCIFVKFLEILGSSAAGPPFGFDLSLPHQ